MTSVPSRGLDEVLMKRREVLSFGGAAIIGRALGANAQQAPMPIFGVLLVFPPESGKTFSLPIGAYLNALGYVHGRNIELDFRFAEGKVERLPALAAELVARRPAVIATFGDATGLAAQAATSTIPIVAMSEDLVRAKLVSNMAHPGGNVTGVSVMGQSSTRSASSSFPRCCRREAGSCFSRMRRHIASRGRRSTQRRKRLASRSRRGLSKLPTTSTARSGMRARGALQG